MSDELPTPEELQREIEELQAQLRAAAGEDNVLRPAFPGQVPEYRLNAACFLEDTYFEEGSVIQFTDMPNLDMVPLNDAAKARMQEHIELLEAGARAKAASSGKPFTGIITDKGVLIANAMDDARAEAQVVKIAMPVEKGPIPQMPHLPEAQAKRPRGRPRKATLVQPPGKPAVPGPEAPKVLGREGARTFGVA